MRQDSRWATLIASVQSLGSTGLAVLHTRIQLLGVELEQELWRARSLLVWGFAALLLGLLALGCTALVVIIAFWDSHRLLASCLVAGAFVAMTLLALWLFQRAARARPRLFEGTLRELQRDIDALRGDR
jgi:uncharacterized membrane protein YqjE